MATNLITVKDVQEKSKDGSTWLELIDQNNRTHRIFRRVQDNEGNWHDLSSKYDMLRNSQNRTLKLTIEQKGRFTNVVDVEVASTTQTAGTQRTLEDLESECRLRTFTTAYAKDLAVAGKISTDTILAWAELFYRYLQGDITVSNDEMNDVLQRAKASEHPALRPTRKAPTTRPMEEGVAR
jgi:hypothetical protein